VRGGWGVGVVTVLLFNPRGLGDTRAEPGAKGSGVTGYGTWGGIRQFGLRETAGVRSSAGEESLPKGLPRAGSGLENLLDLEL